MEFLLGLLVLGLAVFGLSIGVIFNDKSLSGSCGGNADGSCSTCHGNSEKCENTESSQ
ncbi:MAG: ApbE family protein [Candidatus Marinimicrobia bacterium]|nr:ApbE family protein [Candidatus Neomarinimicrobiota bacterium]MBT3495685.1 ApbE family protein [Candidatus Neomarinimicrobiota bacterium]MBT3693114.1 ApbE family protein [Candidatus Neomarinimicrobiota bacterium]MBT3731551.1 ApbE family protein [Candidatus Neomarinimicrobiota bacterium]MBT4144003.1 ApbE family protein [Candidatus Neomarinimicrobiota bacterium]